jgi:4'-phosphopantetheinyl transferase
MLESTRDASRYEEVLSQEERDRTARFHSPLDRVRYALARGVLRTLLHGYTGAAPEAVTFEVGVRGKPRLRFPVRDRRIEFSVSHSGTCILLAFSLEVPVGVDVEEVRPMPDVESIMECVAFSPAEREAVRCSPEPLTAFYALWTLKEAYVKASGEGLSGIRDVEIAHPMRPLRTSVAGSAGVCDGYSFWPAPGYAAALVGGGSPQRPSADGVDEG